MSPPQRRVNSHPIAFNRSINPPTLLHACPKRHEVYDQTSNQVPKPPVPRQTYQHPFLFRLALPLLKMFTHQLFSNVGVWNHSSFHGPFCQTPSFRHLS